MSKSMKSVQANRRQFGLGLASSFLAVGGLGLPRAANAQDEAYKKANAEFTMRVATAYTEESNTSYPILLGQFKQNIESLTANRVYVEPYYAGSAGTGSELAANVLAGNLEAAQHSISNFVPFSRVMDLINLPFFLKDSTAFSSLVESELWRRIAESKVQQNGFKVLWYPIIDHRTLSVGPARTGAISGPISGLEDMRDRIVRIPNSPTMEKFYGASGARTKAVGWGQTLQAVKNQEVEVVDPSIGALNIFGFFGDLQHITRFNAFPDAQLYSCNMDWFRSLPSDIQDAIDEASAICSTLNTATVPSARNFSLNQFRVMNGTYTEIAPDRAAEWEAVAGYQNDLWKNDRFELAGTHNLFARLETEALGAVDPLLSDNPCNRSNAHPSCG